jgi:hypothetical protein
MMTRIDIINHYIEKYKYQSYLEIGCQWGNCFKQIKCNYKMSVDPNPNSSAIRKVTSDFFFKYNEEFFDIIFIDGLHLEEQVDRDIKNSLGFINPNGTIVVHDCLPKNEKEQLETWDHKGAWVGTVWRSFLKCRQDKNLDAFVIDTDHGVGIISYRNFTGEASIWPNNTEFPKKIEYKDFEKNKKEWLGIIPVDKFR